MTSGIPARIHAYWDESGPDMPSRYAALLDRWRDLHPDWELTLWSHATLPLLRNQDLVDDPRRWSPRSNPWMHRANLARYELLLDFGGVWIDVDLEPRQPIDQLIDGVECFAAWETQDRWINNAFMGCVPEHPAIAEIVDGVGASVRAQRSKPSNFQSGARYITPLLRDRSDVEIFDRRIVYPYRWDELDRDGEEFPDAVLVHHWNSRRARHK